MDNFANFAKYKNKNSMKTLISIIFLCFVYGISTQAANDDGDNLYVFTKGASSAVVYSLDHLDKLTFEENAVRLWYDGGKMDYEYGKISLMTFRKDIMPTTGIEPLTFDGADVKIVYERSSSLVSVECGQILQGVAIYDVQGRLVTVDSRKCCSYQVSLQGKPQGVYLIRVDEKGKSITKKIVK